MDQYLDESVLASPFELVGVLGSSEFVDPSTAFATPERLAKITSGRFVIAVYTLSLPGAREHQVYVQLAREIASDAFTQGICGPNKTTRVSRNPYMTLDIK